MSLLSDGPGSAAWVRRSAPWWAPPRGGCWRWPARSAQQLRPASASPPSAAPSTPSASHSAQEFVSAGNIFCLKGQCNKMDIFGEGLNILISAFCVCADGFQGLSKAFRYPIQVLTFYLLLKNYLLDFKMFPETLLRIIFSVICRCSLVTTSHWLQGKCGVTEASCMILQNHGGFM
jgi:hypothetical protein